MAELKFGPHYVAFRTPLSNIRITTFFAGEAEARIVDPTRMAPVDAVGCSVEGSGELGLASGLTRGIDDSPPLCRAPPAEPADSG